MSLPDTMPDTITDLHCSEYAYWPKPEELLRGLFQAVPKSGNISIESTGNGVGNNYHQRCMRAASGRSRFRLHFLPWHTFPEYSYTISDEIANNVMSNLMEEWEEPELVERFELTAGQIVWRREKLEDMDYDLASFKQEYPSTLDECFQASGNSLFQTVNFVPSKSWIKLSPGFFILKDHPIAGYTYSLGADVGGGVGKDNSVIEVVCVETMEQVCEWASNKIGPDVFSGKIAAIGRQFNECLLSVESNNHGIVTLKELSRIYPSQKINSAFKTRTRASRDESLLNMGVSTTKRSKPLMIGNLRKVLAKELTIHSELLNSELSTFIEHETGELAADSGCMDDRVMAMANANVGINKASMFRKESDDEKKVNNNPFLLDNIIAGMSRREGYPIPTQVDV